MSEVWPIVVTVGTEEEAALITGFLESRDVPVRIDSRIFHQEPVTFGQLGNAHVRVPEEYLEEAMRLLGELESAPAADEDSVEARSESDGGEHPQEEDGG